MKKLTQFEYVLFHPAYCPVCRNETRNNHFICDTCGWEFDGNMLDEEYSSANHTTVRKFRELWQKSMELSNSKS